MLRYAYCTAVEQETGTNLCVQGVYGFLIDVVAGYYSQPLKPRQLEPGQRKGRSSSVCEHSKSVSLTEEM